MRVPAPEWSGDQCRSALVIATNTYTDPALTRLRAPASDATDLAETLADPLIGGFDVTTVMDTPVHDLRMQVERFLTDRGPTDLVAVYLACHGLKDKWGHLHFAVTDTRKDLLGSTAVSSRWFMECLDQCQARKQIVLLDCCFSGGFHNTRGDYDLGLGEAFRVEGRGRAVLTASRSSEYSWEGTPHISPTASETPVDTNTQVRAVFTGALIAGLRTGDADLNDDGYICVDDAGAYIERQVAAAGAAQHPQHWTFGAEGKLYLARSVRGKKVAPEPLPDSIRDALNSKHPDIRAGGIRSLATWVGVDPTRCATARQVAEEHANDHPTVTTAVNSLLFSTLPKRLLVSPRPGNQISEPATSMVAGGGPTEDGADAVERRPGAANSNDRNTPTGSKPSPGAQVKQSSSFALFPPRQAKSPTHATVDVRQKLNKVPEMTAFFWGVTALAAAVAANLPWLLLDENYLSLGGVQYAYSIGLLSVTLVVQLRTRRYVPGVYWITFVLVAIAVYPLESLLLRKFSGGMTLVVFAFASVSTFSIWFLCERTLSLHNVNTTRREVFYWLALLANSLLSFHIFLLSENYLRMELRDKSLVIFGIISAVVFARFSFRLNVVVAFWIAYVLVYLLGTCIGILLNYPGNWGGLGLDTPWVIGVLFLAIVGLVSYLTISKRDVTRDVNQ